MIVMNNGKRTSVRYPACLLLLVLLAHLLLVETSLKAILLYNGNPFASLSLVHSVHLGENYSYLPIVLGEINYQEHLCMVYG